METQQSRLDRVVRMADAFLENQLADFHNSYREQGESMADIIDHIVRTFSEALLHMPQENGQFILHNTTGQFDSNEDVYYDSDADTVVDDSQTLVHDEEAGLMVGNGIDPSDDDDSDDDGSDDDDSDWGDVDDNKEDDANNRLFSTEEPVPKLIRCFLQLAFLLIVYPLIFYNM